MSYFQQANPFTSNNGVQLDNNINVNNIVVDANNIDTNNMILSDSTVNNNKNNQLNGESAYTLTNSGNIVQNNSNNNGIGYQYAEVNESADTLDLGATFDNFMFTE